MKSSEKILTICIVSICIILLAMIPSLIPNSPRIVTNKSNQPSFRVAEVEPIGKAIAVTVRQSLGFFIITAYCPCSKCCGK